MQHTSSGSFNCYVGYIIIHLFYVVNRFSEILAKFFSTMLRLTVKQETSAAVCTEEVTFDAYISGNFKVPCGVAIAYIGNDFSKRVLIVGILAVFHPLAYDVAKYAAEVFVAGIGQKAP